MCLLGKYSSTRLDSGSYGWWWFEIRAIGWLNHTIVPSPGAMRAGEILPVRLIGSRPHNSPWLCEKCMWGAFLHHAAQLWNKSGCLDWIVMLLSCCEMWEHNYLYIYIQPTVRTRIRAESTFITQLNCTKVVSMLICFHMRRWVIVCFYSRLIQDFLWKRWWSEWISKSNLASGLTTIALNLVDTLASGMMWSNLHI